MPSEDRLSRAERELFLRSFARGGLVTSPGALRAMTDAMTDGHYPAGSMLYQQGSMPRYMYYVVTGKVRLSAEGQAPLFYDKLSAIGGLDALQDIPYSRTAVAMEDTRVLLMPASKYLQIIEDNFDFARQMVAFMVGAVDAVGNQLPLAEQYRHDRETLPEPPPGERRLGLLERMMVVRQSPLFGGLRSQVLVALAERLEERTIEEGESPFTEGRRSDSFWFVAAGELRAIRRATAALVGASHTFRAGDVAVVFAGFADHESDYQVAATRRARLLGLRKDDFFDLLEDHGDVARVALAYAARQRARLQARLAELQLEQPRLNSSFSVSRS